MPAATVKAPATPSALKARRLTIKLATAQFVTTTKAIAGLTEVQEAAKKFLIATGERTGRRTFLDQIAMERTGGSNVLDQAAVRDRYAELGEKLPKKKSKLGWTLKLLK